jgi:hypothetical protein
LVATNFSTKFIATNKLENLPKITAIGIIPTSHLSSAEEFNREVCIVASYHTVYMGTSLPWSYGSWIYSAYHHWCCEWVRISIRARCTTLCDKFCQWHATDRWLYPGHPVSSTNKTDRHDITEILLKVALNTIKQTNNSVCMINFAICV